MPALTVCSKGVRGTRFDWKTDRACPTGEVKKPRIDNKRMRFLTHEEADTLLKDLTTRSQQLHDMALPALHCGLRAGEIFNQTWGDVDMGRGLLTLRDTKSGKNRMAYMTGEVKKVFERLGSGEQNELVFKSHLSENTCRAAVRNLEKVVTRRKRKVVALKPK